MNSGSFNWIKLIECNKAKRIAWWRCIYQEFSDTKNTLKPRFTWDPQVLPPIGGLKSFSAEAWSQGFKELTDRNTK